MKEGRGETKRPRHKNYSQFPTSLCPALTWIQGSREGKANSNTADPGTAGFELCGSTSTRVFKNKYLYSFQSTAEESTDVEGFLYV